jgi:type IV pilus biogenesis protein CpaD/CtpE
MPFLVRPALLLACLLALAGCDSTDPYLRPGMWQPTGANQRNLAAMVVNPSDLIRGHGESGSDGRRADIAVSRVLEDRTRSLPDVTTRSATPSAAQGGGQGAGQGAAN